MASSEGNTTARIGISDVFTSWFWGRIIMGSGSNRRRCGGGIRFYFRCISFLNVVACMKAIEFRKQTRSNVLKHRGKASLTIILLPAQYKSFSVKYHSVTSHKVFCLAKQQPNKQRYKILELSDIIYGVQRRELMNLMKYIANSPINHMLYARLTSNNIQFRTPDDSQAVYEFTLQIIRDQCV